MIVLASAAISILYRAALQVQHLSNRLAYLKIATLSLAIVKVN